MKTRTLGRIELPDEARDGVLLDFGSLARALVSRGMELWRGVDLAISERCVKVGSKVVFVSGSAGEREPLLVSVALACGAARAGVSVVLVDTGGLEARLGLRELGARPAGFAELVRGGDPGESLHESGMTHLVVVPAGQAAGGLDTPRVSVDELRETLDVLRAHAELVLVPGSLWQGDDASTYLTLADAHLVVRSAFGTSRGEGELPDLEGPESVTGVHAVMLGLVEADFQTPRRTARAYTRTGAAAAASREAVAEGEPDAGPGPGEVDAVARSRRAALRAAFGARGVTQPEDEEAAEGAAGAAVTAGAAAVPPAGAASGPSPANRETAGMKPAAPRGAAPRGAPAKGAPPKRAGGGSSMLRPLLLGGAAAALVGAGAVVAIMHPEMLRLGRGGFPFGREAEPARPTPAEDAGETAPGEVRGTSDEGVSGVPGDGGVAAAMSDTLGGLAPAAGVPAAEGAPAGAADTAAAAVTAPPAVPEAERAAPAAAGPKFVVIVASFKVRSNAEKTADRLRRDGHSPAVWQVDRPGMGRWFRVIADTVDTRATADSLAKSFREAGAFGDALVAACE